MSTSPDAMWVKRVFEYRTVHCMYRQSLDTCRSSFSVLDRGSIARTGTAYALRAGNTNAACAVELSVARGVERSICVRSGHMTDTVVRMLGLALWGHI
jgi:hypothetical protein